MLQYPSIPSWKKSPLGLPCVAFEKYDGSNLRWEWSPKRGWEKYGTRKELFDESAPLWSQAIPIFKDEIGDIVEHQVKYAYGKNVNRITAFTEFFGKSSFAGSHNLDEPKTLKLFDVFIFKKGFISPKEFLKLFDKYEWCASVVYTGNMNQPFINDVIEDKFNLDEGVICKGSNWSAKVKTKKWIDRLKGKFGDDWEKYE